MRAVAGSSPRRSECEVETGVHVGLDLLPVPWLAHLVLVQVLGCEDIGIGEKTRWQVIFR